MSKEEIATNVPAEETSAPVEQVCDEPCEECAVATEAGAVQASAGTSG